ncbi:hypothetical protein F7725_002621 [Dissostichus mawsoni]|uniref:Uncharacterized protein n=1 Tax=Dissostichus mawsoni TaxID=36200 RepID=A0A7J5Y2W3_DISMA|nr:hypothetical protein F7725_002621 [Dissostichus mawsoni]
MTGYVNQDNLARGQRSLSNLDLICGCRQTYSQLIHSQNSEIVSTSLLKVRNKVRVPHTVGANTAPPSIRGGSQEMETEFLLTSLTPRLVGALGESRTLTLMKADLEPLRFSRLVTSIWARSFKTPSAFDHLTSGSGFPLMGTNRRKVAVARTLTIFLRSASSSISGASSFSAAITEPVDSTDAEVVLCILLKVLYGEVGGLNTTVWCGSDPFIICCLLHFHNISADLCSTIIDRPGPGQRDCGARIICDFGRAIWRTRSIQNFNIHWDHLDSTHIDKFEDKVPTVHSDAFLDCEDGTGRGVCRCVSCRGKSVCCSVSALLSLLGDSEDRSADIQIYEEGSDT